MKLGRCLRHCLTIFMETGWKQYLLHMVISADLFYTCQDKKCHCRVCSTGKEKEEIEGFINSGVYQVARLKEEGWITDLLYDDEVCVSELTVSMVKLIAQIVTTDNILCSEHIHFGCLFKVIFQWKDEAGEDCVLLQ